MACVSSQGHSKFAAGVNLSTPTAGAAFVRKDTPSSFRVLPRELFLFDDGASAANGERIGKRIAETREWLGRMSKKVRSARRKQKMEEKAASLLCSALRASSALLTEMAESHSAHRRFRFSLLSFLDGTPFLTPKDLCRYNTAVAEQLSDDNLELLRRHVFDYDEVAFAELLYADGVAVALQGGGAGSADVLPECVRQFNAAARAALERLVAAPGGLADATMRATQLVPIVADDVETAA